MHRVLVALVLAACGSPPAPRSPATPPPSEPPEATPPPAAVTPALIRINAGGWPGGSTHRWGGRFFEVRGEPGHRELRVHDEIDFQGSGMQPADMPPTQHECSEWRPLPSTIEIPAGLTNCRDAMATCDAIRTWLVETGGPSPTHPWSTGTATSCE